MAIKKAAPKKAALKKSAPKATTKMPTGEKPKQLSTMAKWAMRETNNKSQAAFRAGTQRDRFARQTNSAVFNSKTPTSYSPKPMSASEKKAAGFRGATTQWQSMLKKKAKGK